MTQKQMIIDYMDTHGGITVREASRQLGVERLAARIEELRKAGHQITDEWVEGVNRYGSRVRYKKYKRVKDE